MRVLLMWVLTKVGFALLVSFVIVNVGCLCLMHLVCCFDICGEFVLPV